VTVGRLPVHVRLAAVSVFALVVVIRFLDTRGLPNDHFIYLAPAQQMVAGEWPSRDFVDPGTPAMYVVSALAQRMLGPPLFAEAWLVSVAFALAAGLTVVAAFRVSDRLWLAVPIALAQAALFPRSYHYPKYLVYAWLALALIAYVQAPTRRRAAHLALVVVVGFLFRHDHGVYAGGAVTIAALLAGRGGRAAAQRVATVAGFTLLFVAPYLAFVASTTGLVRHLSGGVAYSAAEADRTNLAWPPIPWHTLLGSDSLIGYFYLLHLLPLTALGVLFMRWRQSSRDDDASRVEVALVGSLVALWVALNVAMLRHPLDARLPDVAVPAGLVLAWMLPRAWLLRPRALVRPVVVVVATVALLMVYQVGHPLTHLERTDLLETPTRPLFLVNVHADELNARFNPNMFSSGVMEDLLPFFRYVERCTGSAQRLFVAGDLPEIYVLARRSFAGGQPALRGGLFSTVEDQQLAVARMRQQDVPLAIVDPDGDARGSHIILEHLEAHYDKVAELAIRRRRSNLVLLVSRTAHVTSTDEQLGFPCFR
jgi:hypothetical protein